MHSIAIIISSTSIIIIIIIIKFVMVLVNNWRQQVDFHQMAKDMPKVLCTHWLQPGREGEVEKAEEVEGLLGQLEGGHQHQIAVINHLPRKVGNSQQDARHEQQQEQQQQQEHLQQQQLPKCRSTHL
ncbi:hypothetical protein AWZ03_011567 [Drosophila navojoa]|uniref:Uncharacterized protein n=1 Tax=Drosophila navojoa TaxID=7232 RepID=A0A484AZY5_DRONA|nr:hypothetical protein AWZ03_011567 [Drosophila navojoa]